MSKISQRRALLLAMIVPAMLVTGCAAGSGTQAMKGAASPVEPTDTEVPPDEASPEAPTGTGTEMESPPVTDMGVGGARAVVQQFFNGLKEKKPDQVAKTFADDAVAAVAGQPTATGTDAIQDVFKKQIDRPGNHAQATHNIDEARMAGDNDAIVRSTSKVGDRNMRELFVVSKDGGEWKISRFMSNVAS